MMIKCCKWVCALSVVNECSQNRFLGGDDPSCILHGCVTEMIFLDMSHWYH